MQRKIVYVFAMPRGDTRRIHMFRDAPGVYTKDPHVSRRSGGIHEGSTRACSAYSQSTLPVCQSLLRSMAPTKMHTRERARVATDGWLKYQTGVISAFSRVVFRLCRWFSPCSIPESSAGAVKARRAPDEPREQKDQGKHPLSRSAANVARTPKRVQCVCCRTAGCCSPATYVPPSGLRSPRGLVLFCVASRDKFRSPGRRAACFRRP